MNFGATGIDGAWLIDIVSQDDARGFFARLWCQRELAGHELDYVVVQQSLSYSKRCGTLRGLHFQRPPHAETKIVRCIRGAVFDVIVDLRPHSPTFRSWRAFELTGENRRAIYVPKGVAHGFQTLADDTEVTYQMSAFYVPEAAVGYRYDDPAFAVSWPLPVTAIGERDLTWPAFEGGITSRTRS